MPLGVVFETSQRASNTQEVGSLLAKAVPENRVYMYGMVENKSGSMSSAFANETGKVLAPCCLFLGWERPGRVFVLKIKALLRQAGTQTAVAGDILCAVALSRDPGGQLAPRANCSQSLLTGNAH